MAGSCACLRCNPFTDGHGAELIILGYTVGRSNLAGAGYK
jgi:hypothetical protein